MASLGGHRARERVSVYVWELVHMLRFREWFSTQLTRVHSRLIARCFKKWSPGRIHPSALITNPRYMSLLGVSIGRGVWLYAITGDTAGNTYTPDLVIGKGTQIGDYCHITCAKRVEIGEGVLMTQGVFVSDSNHVYGDITKPILAQGLTVKPVSIGAGSWLGNHAVVVGCSIGKNCVVGANSVVTRDVPDYCVVAGAPAKIIKRFDEATRAWIKSQNKERT
jgi:acetyltransferase-like isoleucine patch superfamily enzyme